MIELPNKYPELNIPIIMLSVAALEKDVESAEKLAHDLGLKLKYATKPFTRKSLMVALAELEITWVNKEQTISCK